MTEDVLSNTWHYPTKIWFGPGRIAELAAGCAEVGLRRPLIVSDPFFSALPEMVRLRDSLTAAGIDSGIFDRLQGNPTLRNLDDGISAFRAGGHDGVIAIGGGSALDVGKTIAFMAVQTRPVWDFEDIGDRWRSANADGIAPIIAVPTTSGTGSEVGRATVITNDATHEKKIIFHPSMLPQLVIADPELTIGLPTGLTAGTGMDALSHNIEAYFAPGYHPMADGIAIEGCRLISEWLPVAFKDGADIVARTHVMAAASMGATAFQKGLGAIHSLSHPLGSVYGFHHGLTNAVLIPYVLDFNRDAIGVKADRLALCLGLPDNGKPGVDRLIEWVLALRNTLEIPETIAELGADPADFDRVAGLAIIDPTAGTNPRPLTAEGAQQILRAAYDGTLP